LGDQVIHLQSDTKSEHPSAIATVRGGQDYACTLRHVEGLAWTGSCTCPVGFRCKHLFAAGLALQRQMDNGANPKPGSVAAPIPEIPPEEASLVAIFTTATGSPPDKKQMAWLRNLLRLLKSVQHDSYIDFQTLQNLVPAGIPYSGSNFYNNPFINRWTHPPASPLELWSHLALILPEKGIPLPRFTGPLTDLAAAGSAVTAHRREQEVAVWRKRFEALEQSLGVSPDAAGPPALRDIRLRLSAKKTVWEVSAPHPADAPGTFSSVSANELRDLISAAERSARELTPAALTLVTLLRNHFNRSGRLTVKLTDAGDRSFLAQLFAHPLCRDSIVTDRGEPYTFNPSRLIWDLRDHPIDPELALVSLVFADGTSAPRPLLHLGGNPHLYLHGSEVFAGLPPPGPDLEVPVSVPRAALALPEAGRFAVRAGIKLPGDTTGRFRRESLRPRLRPRIDLRHEGRPGPREEVLTLELAALTSDGTPCAIHDNGVWRREGPDLPTPPPDQAFLILDFGPTRAAVDQVHRLPMYRTAHYLDGPRDQIEIGTPQFPETFATWIAGFPANTLIELDPELAALVQPATRAHFALDLQPAEENGIDWFDVRVTLRAEDTTLSAEEIALLQAARGGFVRLAGRGWRRLTIEDSSPMREKLNRLGLDLVTAEASAREPLRFHALQLADEALREALPQKLWAQVCERSALLRASPPPALPPGLTGELRPYQYEGFQFLTFLAENGFGGVLADDMGLGKTLQTLAWLLWLAGRDGRGERPLRTLVVCPKSVVVNWQLETARFAPTLTTAVFSANLVTNTPARSASTKSGSLSLKLRSHLLVVNYTQLRLHAEIFARIKWDAVVLDEGQNIKNPASATAKAARALDASHRLVLTGTPIENRLLDLWSLCAFAQPGLLGGQTSFKRLYHDKTDPAGAHRRLAQRVRHFLLRRTKNQVARDLPPRIEEELVVELEGPQRTLYDAELKRTRAMLLGVKSSRDFDHQRFNILQSLLRLRQICCDPRLLGVNPAKLPGRKTRATRVPTSTEADDSESSTASSAKLEALIDALDPLVAEGHKVLIFSQFVTMLELIRDELTGRGIAHLLLTGQTENRQELVDKFQTDPAIPVFLLSLKAAGSGLNLTAASYVVLFDPWWNPAVEAQAIDRTHRIGQKIRSSPTG